MSKIVVMDHPLIKHKIGLIRRKTTGTNEFRRIISEIAELICYEATRDLELQDVEIETPITKTVVQELKGRKLCVVPILRAGLGMVDGMLELIPAAKVGHIGLYRDPETLKPVEYYCKLPADVSDREIFVVDPMLATGGSSAAAIQMLKEKAASISTSCALSQLLKESRQFRKLILILISSLEQLMKSLMRTVTSYQDLVMQETEFSEQNNLFKGAI